MRLFKTFNFDWIGKRNWFFALSIFLILVSIGALIWRKGPPLGTDFTGGTLLQVKFKQLPPIEDIRKSLTLGGWDGFSVQSQPAENTIVLRIRQGTKAKDDIAFQIIQSLDKTFPGNVNIQPERVEFVGPIIGKKLIGDTILAIFGSFFLIIIYVAFRFKNWFWGAAGVLAIMHDVFITFGLLVLTNTDITLVEIAALLTLAGYSINDTIVIFDRVRENLQQARKESPKDILNRSINETMARTINTSLTVFIACLCLLFFGGKVLHGFSLALTFGAIIGSYSTVGIAIGLVYMMQYGDK